VQLTYPTGEIVTYVRDSLGRVTSVSFKSNAGSSAVTLASAIAYEPFGPEKSAAYDPADLNLALARTQDLAGRTTGLSVAQASTSLFRLGLGYDDAGRIVSTGDEPAPAYTGSAGTETAVIDGIGIAGTQYVFPPGPRAMT
jgi:hypothetical protein